MTGHPPNRARRRRRGRRLWRGRRLCVSRIPSSAARGGAFARDVWLGEKAAPNIPGEGRRLSKATPLGKGAGIGGRTHGGPPAPRARRAATPPPQPRRRAAAAKQPRTASERHCSGGLTAAGWLAGADARAPLCSQKGPAGPRSLNPLPSRNAWCRVRFNLFALPPAAGDRSPSLGIQHRTPRPDVRRAPRPPLAHTISGPRPVPHGARAGTHSH
jgi:hypothetical protein